MVEEKSGDIPSFKVSVSDYLPHGYRVYLRLFHTLQMADLTDISWSEIGLQFGGTLTGLTDLGEFWSCLIDTANVTPTPDGVMPDRLCARLVDLLAHYTATPDECEFLFSSSWASLLPRDRDLYQDPLRGSEYQRTIGHISDACTLSVSPTIWSPVDKKWMVVTPLDAGWSLVGCDELAADALTNDPTIEAFAVSLNDELVL